MVPPCLASSIACLLSFAPALILFCIGFGTLFVLALISSKRADPWSCSPLVEPCPNTPVGSLGFIQLVMETMSQTWLALPVLLVFLYSDSDRQLCPGYSRPRGKKGTGGSASHPTFGSCYFFFLCSWCRAPVEDVRVGISANDVLQKK